MIDRATFASYVHDALAGLYDRPYLAGLPLGPLLAEPGQPANADALRKRLLDSIEELRPPEHCPPNSPVWRRYRYLILRYLEGAKPESIARELQISVRQSRREHEHALEALTSLLWEPYRRRALPPPEPAADRSASLSTADAPNAYSPAVGAELLKVGSQPCREPIGLATALDDALAILHRLVEQHKAKIEVTLPDQPLPLWMPRAVLRQVLIDLLVCCLEVQPRPTIKIVALESPQGVLVDVALPEAQSSHRLAPEGEARLEACRRLVELQGGTFSLLTVAGESFHVSLRLPKARVRTLLVVDDNPDVAYMFSRFLRDHGYRVLQASTGQAALQYARDLRPDVITLDVLMPSQDGWDILRELGQDPATQVIPVILCSVLPERSLALSLGVAAFLNKPVTQSALLAALEQCLRDARPDSASG